MRLALADIALALGCRNDAKICGPRIEGPEDITRLPADEIPLSLGRHAGTRPAGARIDSRQVQPGDLFFCLSGENVDGHDFAFAAAKAGACAVVAARPPFSDVQKAELGASLPPVFIVPDVLHALWRIAVCHRDSSLAKVFGVTGTAGKTSVKEVLAQVLSVRGRTAKNHLNLNNQIGLPLSMLNASADASFWVMEAGISEPHDMDELGAVLRPDTALILNAGTGHTEGLGDKGTAYYKAKFADYVMPEGHVLVNADSPELAARVAERGEMLRAKGAGIFEFSTCRTDVYCSAVYIGGEEQSKGRFQVFAEGRETTVIAPFIGRFGAENVAAVFAAARIAGLTAEETAAGFSMAVLPQQRFNCRNIGLFTVVDDSYNANPLSSQRMLEAVFSMAQEAKLPLLLVMGEMLELGDEAEEAHINLGRQMAAVNPAAVYWKGGRAAEVRRGLAANGYKGPFYPVAGSQEFSALLEESGCTEAVVLFKGSRGNRLERLVDTFQDCVPAVGDN